MREIDTMHKREMQPIAKGCLGKVLNSSDCRPSDNTITVLALGGGRHPRHACEQRGGSEPNGIADAPSRSVRCRSTHPRKVPVHVKTIPLALDSTLGRAGVSVRGQQCSGKVLTKFTHALHQADVEADPAGARAKWATVRWESLLLLKHEGPMSLTNLTHPTPRPANGTSTSVSHRDAHVGARGGGWERARRTVPSMRRNGRPICVCQFCGDRSIRLLIVCERAQRNVLNVSIAGLAQHDGLAQRSCATAAYVADRRVRARVGICGQPCKRTLRQRPTHTHKHVRRSARRYSPGKSARTTKRHQT